VSISSSSIKQEPVVIRRAKDKDGAEILECLALAFAAYRNDYTPEGFLDTVLTPDTFQRRLAEMSVFVANVSGRIAGTIGCQALPNGEGHLRGMAVLPECQGTGVSTRLLEAAEEELRRAGCKRVTLDTTEPLKRAVRFYEKHGYSATGKVGDFFGMKLFEYGKPL
jgi:ribosomal protein S18 acetylase RimI-like enzyme